MLFNTTEYATSSEEAQAKPTVHWGEVDQNGWSGPETLPSLILGEKVEITHSKWCDFFVCLFVHFVVVIGFCCLLFVLLVFFQC